MCGGPEGMIGFSGTPYSPIHPMGNEPTPGPLCFGEFELDLAAGELRRNGRRLKLQPQPFKLLVLLAKRAGALVSRDEIRGELWPEGTFVDFDQSVNFTVKQIRDVLRDVADRPLYIETVPRRGYRFIAPVETEGAEPRRQATPISGTTTVRLQKALWTNIAELRLAEERRRRNIRRWAALAMLVIACLIAILIVVK
jgi:DNA-binding winged helix-turn-helix (wHTH) protein